MINAKSKLLNPYYQRNPIKLDKANTYNIDFCSVVPATASQPDPLWKNVLSRCGIASATVLVISLSLVSSHLS